MKKRAEDNDAAAIYQLGCLYNRGECGLPQDYGKAHKLWLRAGMLGDARGHYRISCAYLKGKGVDVDTRKARQCWEVGAMGGDVLSRYNLGHFEEKERGNVSRAVKHYMIAAGAGHDKSLKAIRQRFLDGHATKDDFDKALRAHKEANDEMKSEQREAAASAKATRVSMEQWAGK